MKFEERKGKIFLVLSDGEIEYTREQFREQGERFELMKRFAEISFENADGNNWTFGEFPKEFDSNVKIDLFIENLTKALLVLVDETKDYDGAIEIILWFIIRIDKDLNHIYKKPQKEINQHLRYGLQSIKETLQLNQTTFRRLQNKVKLPPDDVLKELHQFFINIDNDKKIDFLNELKLSFPTEKGISIKAIIDVLITENLLVIGAREFNNFYKELKNHFDRNIGSYQSIQNAKDIPNDIKQPIEKRINPLIIKYQTN